MSVIKKERKLAPTLRVLALSCRITSAIPLSDSYSEELGANEEVTGDEGTE
jgi:hypothetical protein